MNSRLMVAWRRNVRSPRLGRICRGFTLIELMIAMLLGLVVIAGVTSVFLANQRIYRTNGALGDVQDSSRIAFELMASDIRTAGLTGCTNNGQVGNILSDGPGAGGADWWANWGNALHGYNSSTGADPAIAGAASPNQVAGTDSLMLLEAAPSGMTIASNDPSAATFTLNSIDTDSAPAAGDIMIVCDPDHSVLFRATTFDNSSKSIGYSTKGALSNCTIGLGYPTVCTSAGTAYTFGANAPVSKLVASDWYIGTNPLGGNSLYQITVNTSTGAATAQEMVRNVTKMDITYHQSPQPSFVTADHVNDWGAVDAVDIEYTVESTDARAGTDAKPITRSFITTTTVRNRVN